MPRKELARIRCGTVALYGFYTKTRSVENNRPGPSGEEELFTVEVPLYTEFEVEVEEVKLRRVLKGYLPDDVREGVPLTGQITLEFGLSAQTSHRVQLPLNDMRGYVAYEPTAKEIQDYSDNGLFTYYALGHVDEARKGARV